MSELKSYHIFLYWPHYGGFEETEELWSAVLSSKFRLNSLRFGPSQNGKVSFMLIIHCCKTEERYSHVFMAHWRLIQAQSEYIASCFQGKGWFTHRSRGDFLFNLKWSFYALPHAQITVYQEHLKTTICKKHRLFSCFPNDTHIECAAERRNVGSVGGMKVCAGFSIMDSSMEGAKVNHSRYLWRSAQAIPSSCAHSVYIE